MNIFLFLLAIKLTAAFRPADVLLEAQSSSCEQTKKFSQAAVVTNSEVCTNIGLDILSGEGSVADATIAALLCEGVTNPQSMGIGGGFILTIFTNADNKVEVLNAREAAPKAAKKDMFGPISATDISSGGLSVAVPGEIQGYWTLHKKYGKMSWYDLFRPTIDLCRSGITVTKYTAKMLKHVREEIMASSSLKDILVNPQSGDLFKEGELMFRISLADSLEMIAKYGPDVLYRGSLTKDFVMDIQENGGIITEEDMNNYKATWQEPLVKDIGPYKFYATPPPGSGSLLLLILDVMSRKLDSAELFWHRLIETWKFAFGFRSHMTGPKLDEKVKPKYNCSQADMILKKISDCKIYPKPSDYFENCKTASDHGTSNIVIISPNGDAISATSTINLSFGALFISDSTGIILNNEMIDFSIPHHYEFKSSSANTIAPLRQPMSSMVPTIITNKSTNEVRMIVGAAGGFKIITSTSSVILQHLFFDISLEESIQNKRLHHQLRPMILEYEEGFPEIILHPLMQKGHKAQPLDALGKPNSSSSLLMESAVSAIAILKSDIHAVGDYRRSAVAGGY